MLTFAYGSNLDEDQMRARCPSARPLGRARLAGHALAFGGYSGRWGGAVASVVRAPGRTVEGVLYDLSRDDLRGLDAFEGVPCVYERAARVVTDDDGARWRAFVYVLRAPNRLPTRPSPRYLAVVRRAYERWCFDPAPLTRAAAGGRP
jgi:gamma-glutamylcyclotransferase (GGCT)/AIG2-like uncharacterized protein YtfP